jgi:hypothetical protein
MSRLNPTITSRRRFDFRYDRENRRLYVSGSNFDADLGSIKRLIDRGLIPVPLDALIYVLTDGTTRILRGPRLDEGLG